VPSLQDTLVFSYIGYQTQTIPINGRQTINISMKSSIIGGKQLVVVGYGTEQEQNVTGSIATVSDSSFNSGDINSPAELIQGKVAGLQISRPGGNPNASYTIRLRGLSTLGANSRPLVVINGVPGGSLSNVDPNDIQSISVLKSASSTAIYGTRGSNGVIIVTTKSGQEVGNKPHFNVEYKGKGAISTTFRQIKSLNASQFRKFLKTYGNENDQDLSDRDLGHSTNWYNAITRTGYNQSHYLALSGGSGNTNYRISLNYRNQKGIEKNTGFDKINTRLNLNQSALDDRLELSFNLGANRTHRKYGFPSAFLYASIYNPTAPIRSGDSGFAQYGGYYQKQLFDYYNPVAIVEQDQNNGNGSHLKGSLKGTYTFKKYIPGLSISGFYSEREDKLSVGQYFPSTAFWDGTGVGGVPGVNSVGGFGQGFSRNGVANRAENNERARLVQTSVHYKKTIAHDLSLKILGLYSWQEFTNQGFSLSGGNFITDHFGYNNIGAAQEFKNGLGSVGSYKNRNKLISGVGRVSLRFRNTYLLSGSVTREGSSRFGRNNKWGTFYSVQGGIRLANLINIPKVQQLKLRVGYGITGNNAPQDYLSELRYGPQGFFNFNGNFIPAYGPVSNPNPDLKWEKKEEIDIGVDFSLFSDRLGGSIDVYSNKTKNLLLDFDVPVPPNLFDTEWINIGELSNKGLEFQINGVAIQSKDFLWKTGLTGARHLRTKIVTLSSKKLQFGNQQIIDPMGAPGMTNVYLIRVKQGKPIGQIWGPIFEGIENGHWKLKDLNGDGEIDRKDNTVIGNGQPKFTADWVNTFHYKNWSLSILFRGIFGHDLVNTYRAFYENPGQISSYNILASSRKIIKLTDPPKFSSFQVENASFVQLNNVSLSYKIPFRNSKSLRSLQLTLSGQNLFYITNYSGADPEPRYSDNNNPLAPGIARRNTWFNARKCTFGVDFKF
jgi:iron complex outermembrane receptor protein